MERTQMKPEMPPFDSRIVEWLIAGLSLLIGVHLLLPMQSFGNVQTLEVFSRMMPEWCLATIWLALATMKFASLVSGRFANISLGISAAWWAFSGFTQLVSNPYSSTAAERLFIAVVHLLIIWRGIRRG